MSPYLSTRLLVISMLGPCLGCATSSSPGASRSASDDAAPSSKAYPIVLARDYSVGRAYRIEITVEETQAMTTTLAIGEEGSRKSTATHLVFVGTRKALAEGDAPPVEYVVEKATATMNDANLELAPAGTTVFSHIVEGQRQYEIDGQPLPEPQQGALRNLLGSGSSQDANDDDVFGTQKPRAVGEAWPIQAEAAARDIEGITIDPSAIEGTTQLTSVSEVDGIEAMQIDATLEFDAFAVDGLPEQATMKESHAEAAFRGLFPLDAELPALRKESTMAFSASVELPTAGPQVTLRIEMTSTRSKTWFPDEPAS